MLRKKFLLGLTLTTYILFTVGTVMVMFSGNASPLVKLGSSFIAVGFETLLFIPLGHVILSEEP